MDCLRFFPFSDAIKEVARHRSQLLAAAIPALTNAVGHEPLNRQQSPIAESIDLNSTSQTGGRRVGIWPQERLNRPDDEFKNNWMHSDLKNVPYIYNYLGYDHIVQKGNLK